MTRAAVRLLHNSKNNEGRIVIGNRVQPSRVINTRPTLFITDNGRHILTV